tara:strand:- start:15571 stop:16659 length:1089 start_codon:yes stop_codon:yes gene_type:complete
MVVSFLLHTGIGRSLRGGRNVGNVSRTGASLMSKVQNLPVSDDEEGIRLDRWFKRHFPDLGHGRVEKLLRTGQIRVDGSRAKSSTRLEEGQTIRVPPIDPKAGVQNPRKRKFNLSREDISWVQSMVIHRDDDIIALNKPPGLAVQGGSKQSKHLDGLLDGLKFDAPERPKLVHRLDKDTSGLLLLARSSYAASKLTAAFKNRSIQKTYWALVVGVPDPRAGQINAPISKRGAAGQQKMVVSNLDGPSAVSDFATMDVAGRRVAWLALRPHTGRTHQLRVHCEVLGTPILGDGKYGGEQAFIEGVPAPRKLHLHARSLEFDHPRGGRLYFEAPLPNQLAETWRFFDFDPNSRKDVFAELNMEE